MNRALIAIAFAAGLCACSAEPKTSQERTQLTSTSGSALDRFKAADATLQTELDNAAGYAIFPEVKKAGAIVGGSYGKGELYEHGVRTGFCDITQGTVGLQLGAEAYDELIVFKEAKALESFKSGQFALSLNTSAVAVESGAAAHAQYRDGVALFVHAKGGLMAEASVGGQKFSFTPDRGYATGN